MSGIRKDSAYCAMLSKDNILGINNRNVCIPTAQAAFCIAVLTDNISCHLCIKMKGLLKNSALILCRD